MTDYVLTGLVKRRADLTCRLRTLQNEARQAQADIAALDGVIRQLDPITTRAKRGNYARCNPEERLDAYRKTIAEMRLSESRGP